MVQQIITALEIGYTVRKDAHLIYCLFQFLSLLLSPPIPFFLSTKCFSSFSLNIFKDIKFCCLKKI